MNWAPIAGLISALAALFLGVANFLRQQRIDQEEREAKRLSELAVAKADASHHGIGLLQLTITSQQNEMDRLNKSNKRFIGLYEECRDDKIELASKITELLARISELEKRLP